MHSMQFQQIFHVWHECTGKLAHYTLHNFPRVRPDIVQGAAMDSTKEAVAYFPAAPSQANRITRIATLAICMLLGAHISLAKIYANGNMVHMVYNKKSKAMLGPIPFDLSTECIH